MWNISAVGFFYPQAKVIGGNQATNGAGWYVPQKKDITHLKLFCCYCLGNFIFAVGLLCTP
jgi:hypothetical protein